MNHNLKLLPKKIGIKTEQNLKNAGYDTIKQILTAQHRYGSYATDSWPVIDEMSFRMF